MANTEGDIQKTPVERKGDTRSWRRMRLRLNFATSSIMIRCVCCSSHHETLICFHVAVECDPIISSCKRSPRKKSENMSFHLEEIT